MKGLTIAVTTLFAVSALGFEGLVNLDDINSTKNLKETSFRTLKEANASLSFNMQEMLRGSVEPTIFLSGSRHGVLTDADVDRLKESKSLEDSINYIKKMGIEIGIRGVPYCSFKGFLPIGEEYLRESLSEDSLWSIKDFKHIPTDSRARKFELILERAVDDNETQALAMVKCFSPVAFEEFLDFGRSVSDLEVVIGAFGRDNLQIYIPEEEIEVILDL